MFILMMLEKEYDGQALCTVCDGDILNVAKNEPDAVHILYEKTHKSLYGFILSITKDPHDTEDALQETYLAIYRSASAYKPKGKPMAWIFTVAKNAANMQLRRRKDHIPFEEGAADADAFAVIDGTEERMALKAAMELLSDDERKIVMLHAVSGLKNREIASVLNIPLNTVLSKYNRAMKKLRDMLKEE